MSPAPIAVIGAGLVGALAAIVLARRGFAVEVYERRGDPRAADAPAGRSINLNLSARGIKALRAVGLAETVLREAVPMTGRLIHPLRGELAYQPYGRNQSEVGNSVSRAGLNALLVSCAEHAGVRFQFGQRALGFDAARGSVRLQDSAGRACETAAQAIFAADGAASAVRESLAGLPGFSSSVVPLDYGYREIVVPPRPDGGYALEPNALHIWPRGTYMLIALPNPDGSFTGTLFLPFEGPDGFAALTGPHEVSRFFAERFPDVLPLAPGLSQAFLERPLGHMETVRCFPWSAGGRLLLLGDAAHGIVPFFGQGMNAGFEDVSVLDRCVGRAPAGSWPAVFGEFERIRKPDTDAIADMALENFVEMRDRCADPRFLLEKAVEKRLEQAFPGDYASRYTLVTFTDVPYALARKAGAAMDEILRELCKNLSRAEDVDLGRARTLLAGKLAPLLKESAK